MINFRLLVTVVTVLLLFSPGQACAGEAQYRLAPGDQIRIHVFGEDDLNLEARLDSTGEINYPFLGKIRVTGLTVEELQNKLIDGLRDGYLRAPQVNVSIVEHRSFFIEGEVKNPGAYPYQPGLTIRKAVSLAGGYTEFADREHYHLVHDKSPGRSLLISDVNTPVRPGDSITLEKSVFYIDGEVNKVGSYPYHSGLTLREAISLAGGLTERASESNIVIVSSDGSQRAVDKAGMSTKIKSGDSIRIKQSFF
ncbi:SLBB domain-containing protein [Mariprofundus ferrooxydans]|uniref:SLBB domain-containing protein n=1 Tax=Mariprofundus ferrooxydans TaxID=314344 RepID=UPI00036A0F70|nr:polysaccharide biosynthesis/export family protein [Mariprofundus ferrooxydans]